MIEMIYVSRAVKRLNEHQITDLLNVARHNNESAGITGLLLYDGLGTFIQALEGEQETLSQLFSVIKKDKRHERINLLWEQKIESRQFPDWKMGYRNMQEFQQQNRVGYSSFLEAPEKTKFLSSQPGFVKDMLLYFRSKLV